MYFIHPSSITPYISLFYHLHSISSFVYLSVEIIVRCLYSIFILIDYYERLKRKTDIKLAFLENKAKIGRQSEHNMQK